MYSDKRRKQSQLLKFRRDVEERRGEEMKEGPI